MKKNMLGKTNIQVPNIVVGCMRINSLSKKEMNSFIHTAIDNGANYFDHADIYGAGECESMFGEALKGNSSIKRENIILQSKCGIRKGYFDFSKEYIVHSVDGILKRLHTEYLDVFLLHRPDALMEPEEIAEAFEILQSSGKVKHFGVSNHNPMQIQLLKKYIKQDIVVNQLQFSIAVSNMVASGLEVNMSTDGAINRDGSVLDFCRLNDITIQAWSAFQMPNWEGCFIGSEKYPELNNQLTLLAKKYDATETTIAASWILRHPAKMQAICGTTNESRLKEIISASEINLTREEWYSLYISAGHILP